MESNVSSFSEYKRRAERYNDYSIEYLRKIAQDEAVSHEAFQTQFMFTQIQSIDELGEIFDIASEYRPPEIVEEISKIYFKTNEEN